MDIVMQARAAMRRARVEGRDWRDVYADALRTAHEAREVDIVPRLAGLAAAQSVSDGDSSGALGYLAYGLAITARPPVRAQLLVNRAVVLMLAGELHEATRDLASAQRAAEECGDPVLEHEVAVYEATVDCLALHDVDTQRVAFLAHESQRGGSDWLSSGLLRWALPWLVATGRERDIAPWLADFTSQAESTSHPWRVADAALIRIFLEYPRAQSLTELVLPSVTLFDDHRARFAALSLYDALSRQTTADAEDASRSIVQAASRLTPDVERTVTGFFALVAAAAGEHRRLPPPPPVPTLQNLAGALAAAESAARTGDEEDVRRWREWLGGVPPHIRTTAEWPAAVDRVRGQLAVREGDYPSARAHLDAALAWSGTHGHWREEMRASALLRELSQVERKGKSPLTADRSTAPTLTPREIAVLRLLEQRMTYKDAARELGIQWMTVRVHARSAYRKLGAQRGRRDAIAIANDTGVLSSGAPQPRVTQNAARAGTPH